MILDRAHRRAWFRYVFAIVVVAAAAAVRMGLLGGLGQRVLFITFYPAVILAALYGGFPAGMLAAILSAAAADYIWMEPVGRFAIKDSADLLGLAVFLLSCTMISLACQAMHRARARADIAEAQAQLAAERARAAEEIQRISEQAQKAQRESREREQLLANIIEKAEQPLAVGYPDGRMGISNRAFCELTGYSAEELRSVGWTSITPPEWAETEKAALAKLERTREPVRYQKEYIAKDGRHVPIELLVQAERNDAGQVELYYAFVTDISGRKEAEEALRQQREWLRVTLTSIGDAVLATDTAGKVTFLNPVAAALTGWTEEQAMGQPVQDVFRIVNEQTRVQAEDIVGRVLREGHVVLLANHTALVARDGNEIPVEDSAAPIKDSAGKVTGVVLVFHDVTEKRRALEAMRRASEQRRLALEAAELGSWYYQFETGDVFWDERCRDMWGILAGGRIDYEEAIARIHAEDRAGVDEAVKQALAGIGGGAYHREFRVEWPDGSVHWISSHGRVYFEGDGDGRRAVRFAGANLEITGRKRAEDALRESEAQFRTLANAIPQLCWMANADGWLFWYNQRWYQYTGTTPEQMEGWGWQSAHDPALLPGIMERWKAALAGGETFDMIFPLRGADGVFRPFLTRATPVRGQDGKIVRWFGTNTDVSEQRKIEEELRQSQERLRAALEASHTGTWHWNIRTGEVEWHESCGRLFGLASGRKMQSTEEFLHCIHPDDRAAVAADVRRCAAQGSDFYREFRVVWPDGSVHWLADRGTAYCDEAGKPAYMTGACVEITDRKRAEESLRQAQKLESVGLLAGGIAHDFNNLLVGVIGNASMAEDLLPQGSPAVEHLQAIVKAGEQAAHLTRQMLAYAGKGRFLLEPVNLSGLVGEARTLVQSSVSKKITFHVRLAPDLPAVEADSSQMQQVFLNLALNAAEAIGSNAGVISVGTGEVSLDAATIAKELDRWPIEPGRHVFLEVRDTGCGMDAAVQAKIFDPFFSTKFQGRGLGLAAVAGIVRAQKGAIQLTTAPDAGSTFRVLLPAMGTAVAAAATALPAERKEDLRGAGTILVVDDEQLIRDLAKRCLERQGYEVVAAGSGAAAIEILRSQGSRIRLVVLDLSMPGMGGEETLPRLRELQPDLPVIVSSGHSESEALRPFGNTRLSGFLQKPYTVMDLARRVKGALG